MAGSMKIKCCAVVVERSAHPPTRDGAQEILRWKMSKERKKHESSG